MQASITRVPQSPGFKALLAAFVCVRSTLSKTGESPAIMRLPDSEVWERISSTDKTRMFWDKRSAVSQILHIQLLLTAIGNVQLPCLRELPVKLKPL